MKTTANRGVIIGAAVVAAAAVAGVLLYVMMREEGEPGPLRGEAAPARGRTAAAPRPLAAPGLPLSEREAAGTAPRAAAQPVAPVREVREGERVEAGLVRRLGPKAAPRKLVPGVRRSGPTNAPNPLATLRTTSERVMSQLLRARPGDPVIEIPLGDDFAQDFAAALKNEIVIYETDSEADAEHKIAIGWMKEGMREMVEAGESPAEILIEYRRQLNELAAYRRELQGQLNELRRAGDREQAAAFVAEANEILDEYGVRPLVLSPLPPRR